MTEPASPNAICRSTAFNGTLFHHRHRPVLHTFSYRAFGLAIDLSELTELAKSSWAFGYNRRRLSSIHDIDYLHPGDEPLPRKLASCLEQAGWDEPVATTTLVTSPRLFGLAFNPVNFYLLRTHAYQIKAVLAEVNNTYGERHVYLFRDGVKSSSEIQFQHAKRFFVSPFNNTQGDYLLTLREESDRLRLNLRLNRDGKCVMSSGLDVQMKPFSPRNLLAGIVQAPGYAALAIPRIAWQGLRLKRKGLKDLMKPHPPASMTLRRRSPQQSQRAQSCPSPPANG
jgi:cyclopropane-fatty-acyl-phospholipid synthase